MKEYLSSVNSNKRIDLRTVDNCRDHAAEHDLRFQLKILEEMDGTMDLEMDELPVTDETLANWF
jgi:hypothetical protein